jgi:hypothetical protein
MGIPPRWSLALVTTALAMGCGDGGDDGPRFANAITLLRAQCRPCHTIQMAGLFKIGESAADDALAHAALLAPSAGEACGALARPRVVPRDPAASLLVQKVEAKAAGMATAVCGMAMPAGAAREPLTAAHLDTLRAWIASGAPGP